MQFYRAYSATERANIDQFLFTHNDFDAGSTRGYVAYYATTLDGKLIAAAKVCPMHTPQAAIFFGADAWRHVYNLQRLAAYGLPHGQLSSFLSFILKDQGKNPKAHFLATYADTSKKNLNGVPQLGTVYRAANAVYCGMTKPSKKVIGYRLDGMFRSIRKGGITLRRAEIPAGAALEYATLKHRWAWAVGPPVKKAFRHADLAWRMRHFKYEAIYQPNLLIKLWRIIHGEIKISGLSSV